MNGLRFLPLFEEEKGFGEVRGVLIVDALHTAALCVAVGRSEVNY
jgi:hypothetical protein